jgi:2-phosphosulfolactate phosphatase
MKRHELNVHNLPSDVAERDLASSVVVVIDVLRATSTICQALASGASEVVPYLEVEDALVATQNAGRSTVVLGGERKGGKIPGFDFGNSPGEYTPEAMQGRKVFITTTNGTRALHHARLARRILVGSFLNLSTVVASVENEARIDVLCAGTDGHETREDILAAGAIVDGLVRPPGEHWLMNRPAELARSEWLAVVAKAQGTGRSISQQLASELCYTQGGRNLLAIGLDRDLVDCAQMDRLRIAPELDVGNWRIKAS